MCLLCVFLPSPKGSAYRLNCTSLRLLVSLKMFFQMWRWYCTPTIPALGRQRKNDHKFEVSLVYLASFTLSKTLFKAKEEEKEEGGK